LRVIGSDAAFVVAENHVHDPMQAVLDRPVAAHHRSKEMRFSVSPRPATSLASQCGAIWAAGSRWRGTSLFTHSTVTSERVSGQPDRGRRLRFCPSYLWRLVTQRYRIDLITVVEKSLRATETLSWRSRPPSASVISGLRGASIVPQPRGQKQCLPDMFCGMLQFFMTAVGP
jgi:hypothetical protein